MINKFSIDRNSFLTKRITGYYHQLYTGYGQAGNPDFINTLKNTYNNAPYSNLLNAQKTIIEIIHHDLLDIIDEENLTNCLIIGVPRAKALNSYSQKQLLLKDAIKKVAQNIRGVFDGTDCIIRTVNTKTTHIKNPVNYVNDGDDPYPGITVETCEINQNIVANQNIILIDDIYTKGVNIDEDCIQALLDNGAKNVIFYSIAYTRRDS